MGPYSAKTKRDAYQRKMMRRWDFAENLERVWGEDHPMVVIAWSKFYDMELHESELLKEVEEEERQLAVELEQAQTPVRSIG